MLIPRYELAPYYGKCIELIGTYAKDYDYVQFEYKEEFRNVVSKKAIPYNPQTGLITPMYFVDSDKCPEYITPIQIIDKGSIISNVRGDGQFSNICLDHIILQCNILKTYKISLGSNVWIYGRVGAYKAGNKDGGYDYCIEDIVNIKSL